MGMIFPKFLNDVTNFTMAFISTITLWLNIKDIDLNWLFFGIGVQTHDLVLTRKVLTLLS